MFTYDRNLDLREEARPFHEKLKKIKVALFDVDGICTNGKVYYSGQEVGFNRFFHVRDGYGMKILKKRRAARGNYHRRRQRWRGKKISGPWA